MRRRNSLAVIAVLMSAVMLPAGCKKKEEPPPPQPPAQQKPVSPAKPSVQQQVSSARSVAPPSATAQFDFSNRKDPFKPFVQPKPATPTAAAPLASAGLLPIQSYGVEQFRVSGIIVGMKENKALILDPAGKGYVVKQGMTIGSSGGIITKIAPSYLEISERLRDDTGKVSRRTVKLSLPKKQ